MLGSGASLGQNGKMDIRDEVNRNCWRLAKADLANDGSAGTEQGPAGGIDLVLCVAREDGEGHQAEREAAEPLC